MATIFDENQKLIEDLKSDNLVICDQLIKFRADIDKMKADKAMLIQQTEQTNQQNNKVLNENDEHIVILTGQMQASEQEYSRQVNELNQQLSAEKLRLEEQVERV